MSISVGINPTDKFCGTGSGQSVGIHFSHPYRRSIKRWIATGGMRSRQDADETTTIKSVTCSMVKRSCSYEVMNPAHRSGYPPGVRQIKQKTAPHIAAKYVSQAGSHYPWWVLTIISVRPRRCSHHCTNSIQDSINHHEIPLTRPRRPKQQRGILYRRPHRFPAVMPLQAPHVPDLW